MGRLETIFTTMLSLVVALALTGTVQASVTEAVSSGLGKGNLTGSAKTLCNLVPLFWVIMVLGIGIGAVYFQFKGS